jgi:acyl-CoA thioesterase
MLFSELLRAMVRGADGWSAPISDDWMQGRSAFGGLQAAQALRAMRGEVGDALPLRALQVTFVGPVPAGSVAVRAQVLRRGASVSHVQAQLLGDALPLMCATGVFGAARPSAVEHWRSRPRLDEPGPVEMRFVAGKSPAFMQHFAARWLRGDLPFTGNQLPEATIELALHDSGPASEAHVVAMADFAPPIALSMLAKPTPGSSMTWLLELLADRFDHWPLQGWRVDVVLEAAREGYTSQSLVVYAPDGSAVALGRQSMVVFG